MVFLITEEQRIGLQKIREKLQILHQTKYDPKIFYKHIINSRKYRFTKEYIGSSQPSNIEVNQLLKYHENIQWILKQEDMEFGEIVNVQYSEELLQSHFKSMSTDTSNQHNEAAVMYCYSDIQATSGKMYLLPIPVSGSQCYVPLSKWVQISVQFIVYQSLSKYTHTHTLTHTHTHTHTPVCRGQEVKLIDLSVLEGWVKKLFRFNHHSPQFANFLHGRKQNK